MQIQRVSKEKNPESFEFEMKWLEYLDRLYYSTEKIVLDLADKELQILCQNSLYKDKLKAALLKNSDNIELINCDCFEEE